jgi:hypothetical protein
MNKKVRKYLDVLNKYKKLASGGKNVLLLTMLIKEFKELFKDEL